MYQVWTKGDEYSGWARKDCPDLPAALAEVLAAIRAGKDPLLTAELKFNVSVVAAAGMVEEKLSAKEKCRLGIKESKKGEPVEVKKSEAESDKVAGA
jgi:hypothetical protein